MAARGSPGVGEVDAGVAAGIYLVTASATGQDVRRTVTVGGGDAVVTIDAPVYASAAPVVGTSTYVAAHAHAAHAASERLPHLEGPLAGIVVLVRRPGGVSPGPLPRRDGRIAITLADASGGSDVALEWVVEGGREHGEWAVAATRVQAGTYVATIGVSSSCLAVPTWSGWQTLLFVPVTADGPAPAMAVMHAAPLATAWTPDAPAAALSDRLHWAVLDGVELTARASARLATTSPLAALMAGAGNASNDLDPASLPVLARDADRLLDAEIGAPGTITGPAIDAFAGRLSSPLWFRWRPPPARPDSQPAPFSGRDWSRRVRDLSTPAIYALAEQRPGDHAVARLAAYAEEQDDRRANDDRRRARPRTDIAEVADVVAGTGVPAIGLLAVLRALPPPAPRPPWRAIGAVGAVVLAAAVIGWMVRSPDDRATPDGPSVTAPSTGTGASTRPTQDSSAATAGTSPVTGPPASTPGTSPSTAEPTILTNEPPLANTMNLLGLEDTKITPTFAAEDPNNDPLTFEIVSGAEGGDVQVQEGDEFVYAPRTGFTGQDSFTYSVRDGDLSAEATVTIDVQPNVTAEPGPCRDESEPASIRVQLTQPPEATVTVDLVPVDGTATVGEDFDPPASPLTFAPGDSTAHEVEIPTHADDEDESGGETFTIELAVRYEGAPQPVVVAVPIGGCVD